MDGWTDRRSGEADKLSAFSTGDMMYPFLREFVLMEDENVTRSWIVLSGKRKEVSLNISFSPSICLLNKGMRERESEKKMYCICFVCSLSLS